MKKVFACLLLLALIAALPFALVGCKKKKIDFEIWDASKYTETIDLSKYECVLFDDFTGTELDRTLWSDTRQGTRRDGFWTKNLAYVDGDGHLIIRTEMRGSRYCSDTKTRRIEGATGSLVTVQYDDCYPFGMIAGDFGEIEALEGHTEDMVGYVITGKFDDLADRFSAFLTGFEIPSDGTAYFPVIGDAEKEAYAPFYETAAELFSYYSFVADIKEVSTPLEASAVIGVTTPYAMAFGSEVTPQSVDFRAVVAHLFGFSEEDFVTYAQSLAETYGAYRTNLANGDAVKEALENGCFRTTNESFVFPIAFRNESDIVLTYAIVDPAGEVSVWVNDIIAAMKATNYSAAYFTGDRVTNETYCKNTLFVTGPVGVYSGAIRTMDTYTHGFGYYEIRCKLPSMSGLWHAFWLMCGDVYSVGSGSSDGVEIDVFEYLPARDGLNVALHWDGYEDAHQNIYKRFEQTNLADGEYHTFGMNWDETGYTFYIDCRKVWHTTGDGVCAENGHMLISTEVGEWSDWVGTLLPQNLPLDWVIDYVKIYDCISE